MPSRALTIDSASPLNEDCRLHINLLGQMEVQINRFPMPRLRSRKGLWLLAILALRAGRDVDRLWLAGTLWPDCEESHALRSLRQSLHDLRLALGTEAYRLQGKTSRTLSLDMTGTCIDVLTFDAMVARGEPDSLEAGIRLYRGPLLEECTEEWVLEERHYREQSYISALQMLASLASAHHEPKAAAVYLRLAVGADPFREDLQRALMQALARSGDTTGALLVYRQFRALIWQELATAPEEATTDLFREIREGTRKQCLRSPSLRSFAASPAAQTSRIRHLPVPITDLIGRDAAVREVMFLLGKARLVTLTGTGGIGKTRLALQIATELDEEYEHGARFANLAPVADPRTIPDVVRDALSIGEPDTGRTTMEALRTYLAGRHLLLVLDNCEHLLPACAELAEGLLCHCPEVRILATSRQALGIRGETVWRVPSLPLPPSTDTETAPGLAEQTPLPVTFGAVELFVKRAHAVESSFRITPRNAASIVQVCRRLDGIPLAIELAAARVRSLSVEEISARLRKDFGLVTRGSAHGLPRQRTLAATFEWSWELLSAAEQIVLRRFSVFAGGASLEAVEAVCGGAGIDQDAVVDLLTSLVDKSLVVYLPASDGFDDPASSTGESRYHLLETVRQFAAERMRASDERDAMRNRHRDHFLEWAEGVKPRLWSSEQAHWFRRLELEHDNLRAALEWSRSRDGDAEQELRMVVAVSRFWDTRGYVREGRAHLEVAIGRMRREFPHSLRVTALGNAGWAAFIQGDYCAARSYYEAALIIVRDQGDLVFASVVLNDLGSVATEEGDFIAARAFYEEAITLYRSLGRPANLGVVLNNLGNLVLRQGDIEEAQAYLEESASWCASEEGMQQQYGITLLNLSVAAFRQEQYEKARAHCAESLRILHASGALVDIPCALDQLALLAHKETQWERAARLLGAAEGLRSARSFRSTCALECADVTTVIRRALGADAFDAAFAWGSMLTLEQAIDYALRSVPSVPALSP